MKYVKKYESFKSLKDQNPVNEEFLFGLMGKLFGKIKERINKTKGGKELETVYQKWLKVVNDGVAKLGITELNILNASADKSGEKPGPKDDEKSKALRDLLNKNKAKIEQVIAEAQKGAEVEMNGILDKMGGSKKNPQLEMLIKSKLIQFKIDVLNAQIAAFNSVGDAGSAANIQKESDAESKKVEDTLKNFDTAKAVEFKPEDTVIYKREKFVQADWDKLTEDDKKKPNEGKVKELVDKGQIGTKKISKVEGDKISFQDADFTKTIDDLLMKIETATGEKAEGQEDLTKKLGELKAKNPDDIKKVSDFVSFMSDEKNKDKVAEIEKIMTGGA